MGDVKDGTGRVACFKCRYYQVTWDPRQPYGCGAHGFKTYRNPAMVVYESSGIVCQLFQPKDQKSGAMNHDSE